ncbi:MULTISPECIES: biotin--[acetyl-CoA-carboxylase] ligase [Micromonospora]|uniref:biotin--[biotin carboxyl-carrier protein] ligase n=1 Tax=Micromonospora chalcea TaxID=1874 RepID=A0ABX9YAT7_MICCH|nr:MULTISPECIES: biotin--[acetyl-CoA-carboxylase] ligase [Micromonospora]EWM65972.1 biotin-[acetyl-CoA-carboxylase] ligase [Micromonospora sp. M42]MBC8989234.1 biotin--[acetyl-CoA-carboxylase] ligase [Micromonospora chalcea]MBP1780934.1 BirA family biotin operon repressor/biotin-[acetyl-CoA-carboxylase] ligase [Micromonospora sp. HB375]MBQ1061140.1 biotin--[acetyl-CoA-carboxylase] ligase [Micromonospora sp. C41]MBQ1067660.1 biotin--[acetyl-CoA-carboxylase] ligase [Micromonospora sp. D75]
MPGSPYTDLDRPPLSAARLRRALVAPNGPWRRLELLAETGSTNADTVAAARGGEPEGLVVVAERQTSGRGRRGRVWQSPPRAGLATSVLLRPGEAVPERGWAPVPVTGYGWLPLLAGVALVEAVRLLAELDARLKWPNDLLVDGAKCAGVLAEAVPGENDRPPAIVVGVGLNVTLRADELPENPTGLPATSLQLAGATATDRDPLLRALLRSLADWYERWRDAGGDAEASGLREAYLAGCATIGRQVRVLLPDGSEAHGTATGVDADGQLLVETNAETLRLAAGDVLHLR